MEGFGEAHGLIACGIKAVPRAVDEVVLPHLLSNEINLAVTTKTGIIAGDIVAGNDRRHIGSVIIQFQCAVLAREQQPVARRVEHGIVGRPFHTVEQALQRGHLHLLGHGRQQHSCQ